MAERPIPEEIMTELANHVSTMPDGQEMLFTDKYSRKKWKRGLQARGLLRPQVPRFAGGRFRVSGGSKRRIDRGYSEVIGALKSAAHK